MGQPNPPGDNIPLVEGLDSSWNEFVSALPEDKRAELGPKLKERINSYESRQKEFEPWEQFQKSGITPDFADTALRLFSTIENNPREVYETIGKHLNITPAEAKTVVEEVKKGDPEDPRIQTIQTQLDTLTQITLAQRQMSAQEQADAEADAVVDQEIGELKKKYGDFPEDEVLMRMLHKGLSAEDAYNEYSGFVDQVRSRRPAPMLLGQGGAIPSRAIDPTKLDSKGTKDLVRQMLDHANAEK